MLLSIGVAPNMNLIFLDNMFLLTLSLASVNFLTFPFSCQIPCQFQVFQTSSHSIAWFLKLELSRESRVIPGIRNSSVLATANLGLSSE